MKICVGMSGGVDSSVAACLLKEQGHDVEGIMMSIWDGAPSMAVKKHACYGPDEAEDIAEAKRICSEIGIPFHVFDCSQEYKRLIVENFRSEYLLARTPNPCVRCNHLLKFGILPALAERSGLHYDLFATGHYAQIEKDENRGRYLLKKGFDETKDQSYFLYRLTQSQLAKSLFPLGVISKTEVRSIAKKFGLSVAEKEESQDFYSGDYRELINPPESSGDIVTSDGKVVGKHSGLWNFTPGQRRGIGIAASEPLYVVKLDPETNQVVIGKKEECLESVLTVIDCRIHDPEKLEPGMHIGVRLRSGMKEAPGTVLSSDINDSISIRFTEPQQFVSPGQSAVFYSRDIVLGGGIIKKQDTYN
jgi:tRNA-uridine 2-sulfurtransferase